MSVAGGVAAVGRCPACGSRSRSFAFWSWDWIYRVPGSFALHRCNGCASVYPDPRPDASSLASYYPEADYYAYAEPVRHRLFARTDVTARTWYALRRGVLDWDYGYRDLRGSALLAATVGRLPLVRGAAAFSLGPLLHPLVPGGALVDLGCGSGRYLDLMRALGWCRVVGVDTSPAAVRQARDVLGLEAHLGDVRDLRLPEGSFDAVTMSHMLEHVDDPAEVLAEARRITRRGGRIAIEVPNVRSLSSRLLGSHWVGLETPRHLVNFSPRGLRTAVERAGLRLESLQTSAQGARGVALFSWSRARGDDHAIYTDAAHRFGAGRRALATGLAGLEHALCAARVDAGEKLWAVARR